MHNVLLDTWLFHCGHLVVLLWALGCFTVDTCPPPQGPDGTLVRVPTALALSAEKLEPSGVYLLENGFEAMLFFNREASPEVVQQLLGTKNIPNYADTSVHRLYCTKHWHRVLASPLVPMLMFLAHQRPQTGLPSLEAVVIEHGKPFALPVLDNPLNQATHEVNVCPTAVLES